MSPTPPKSENHKRRFILFIAEGEPNSLQAERNLHDILAERDCDYDLQISDVFKEFELAAQYNVLVIPCLVMVHPEPAATIIGTMKDTEKVCRALRLE